MVTQDHPGLSGWALKQVTLWKEVETDRRADPGRRSCKDEKVTVTLLEAKGTLGLRKLERQDILPLRSRRDGPADS